MCFKGLIWLQSCQKEAGLLFCLPAKIISNYSGNGVSQNFMFDCNTKFFILVKILKCCQDSSTNEREFWKSGSSFFRVSTQLCIYLVHCVGSASYQSWQNGKGSSTIGNIWKYAFTKKKNDPSSSFVTFGKLHKLYLRLLLT